MSRQIFNAAADQAHSKVMRGPWPPDDPFTAEMVLALLRNKVLKGGAPLPASTDPGIAELADKLNCIRWLFRGWTGHWREEQKRLQTIAEAIWVLTEVLPQQRGEYAEAVNGFERWNMAEAAQKARADLAAIDELVAIARSARERGLPLSNHMITFSPQTERWTHFAELLYSTFMHTLPNQSKAAAYRFVVAVTPLLSHEHPTLEAVQTAFKRNRLVKRGTGSG